MSKSDGHAKIRCEPMSLVDLDKAGNTIGCEECEMTVDDWFTYDCASPVIM
jgi:hypothetical protein